MNKLSKRLHKKLWSIHNWVGLYAGVAIAILSITGVAALFKFEIDEGLNYRRFNVEKQEHYADLKPVFDSLDTVYGIENFTGLQFPKGEGKSWIRTYSIRKSFYDSEQLHIFIDPYTGEVLGKRDYLKSLAYFVRNVHVRLYEAVLGRQIVGIVGLALLISTITGFWIYGGFMKKQVFAAIRQKNLRIKMADYHKLIGVTTLLFNLMIAITGFWLGIQPRIPHQK